MIQCQNYGYNRVNIQLNIAGHRFNSGPLNKTMVELAKRVAIMMCVILNLPNVCVGIALGVCIVLTGAMTSNQARNIFHRICNVDAGPALGIALAAYFYTPIVVIPIAALLGGMAMNTN